MTIRAFIALPIAQETTNELGDIAAKMSYQDKSGAVRWVGKENYHVTLAFLGEQPEVFLDTLAEQLDYHIQQVEFRMMLSHLSPFPETRPKLMAAMVDSTDDIKSLHKQVIAAIKSTDMVIDKRKFIPHLTLGRFRNNRNHYVGDIPLDVSFETTINEVVLYHSVLTATGAEYEPVYRFPLDYYDEHEELLVDEG